MTVTILMATVLAAPVHTADLPSSTPHDVVKTDSPSASVYPKQLVAYRDKPQSDLAREGNKLIYGFSCFPSFAPSVCVRLHVNETGDGIVFLNRWCGSSRALEHRQYFPEGTQYDVSAPEVSKFLALLKSAEFWNMLPEPDSPPDWDGSTWILEGIRNGEYHVVSRRSPEQGEFRDAGLLLMNYAGLDACEALGHLGQYKLHKLEFVGLIVRDNPPTTFAIVKTPEGDLVRARTGSGMGSPWGKVIEITEDYIQTSELVPDGQGGWRERENCLYRRDSKSQRNDLGK
jgi:type IV pilus assembly protein PilP